MKNTIKVERARHNMTQAELADKVNVTRQTINAIEASKYDPSATLAFRIARVFGVRVDDLFSLEEEE
ncbi:helix-turn-helix transcriptional regulator [Nemorincola caseinilytica]|uniref:Helix-turn-helix transcriptional regulator n=1 Tax=Nemorincola caseinilytica TaxID=2054315 RepID=A0ABP8N851_9BACT